MLFHFVSRKRIFLVYTVLYGFPLKFVSFLLRRKNKLNRELTSKVKPRHQVKTSETEFSLQVDTVVCAECFGPLRRLN